MRMLPASSQTPRFSPSSLPTQAFSLIELLVVITLLTMLVLVAVGLFFTTTTGSNKNAISLLVKQQGDNAMGQITSMVRNATRIQTCAAGSLTIKNQDDGVTTFTLQGTQIASNSGIYLTGSDVTVSAGPTFTCTLTSGEPSYVTVTFKLKKGDITVDKPIDVVEQTFTGSAGVRRY